VLLLQGNTGTGANWLRPTLADELFKPGQPLDAGKYFIVMPDALGRGGSSKPSDGLKGKFPHYRYHDMVDLTHQLVTEGLKIVHLRLVIGSSLGCMQQFMWAETYPDLNGRDGGDVVPAGRDQRSQLLVAPRRVAGDPPRSRLEQRRLREEPDALHLQRRRELRRRKPGAHPGDGADP
jgi:pimeloyl-ACP methyl ester carboxylesterase